MVNNFTLQRLIMNTPTATWVCKDGRELVICDMELSHIKNAIAYLRNKGAVTEQEFNTHLACLTYALSSNTPDGASLAAANEAKDFEASMRFVSPELQHLIDERDRRLK